MSSQKQPRKSASCSASLTVPELEQSKTILTFASFAKIRMETLKARPLR